jgi:regulator of replication initiation timing
MNNKELLSDLKYKLDEAIKINDSLSRENEQLKWKVGGELVDLREENEKIRMKFEELSELSMELVDYNYDSERTHYDETIDEDGEGGEGHIFHTLIKIQKLTN